MCVSFVYIYFATHSCRQKQGRNERNGRMMDMAVRGGGGETNVRSRRTVELIEEDLALQEHVMCYSVGNGVFLGGRVSLCVCV